MWLGEKSNIVRGSMSSNNSRSSTSSSNSFISISCITSVQQMDERNEGEKSNWAIDEQQYEEEGG